MTICLFEKVMLKLHEVFDNDQTQSQAVEIEKRLFFSRLAKRFYAKSKRMKNDITMMKKLLYNFMPYLVERYVCMSN